MSVKPHDIPVQPRGFRHERQLLRCPKSGKGSLLLKWIPLPLALGFAAAVPVTWLQRRARLRIARRRAARRGAGR